MTIVGFDFPGKFFVESLEGVSKGGRFPKEAKEPQKKTKEPETALNYPFPLHPTPLQIPQILLGEMWGIRPLLEVPKPPSKINELVG